MSATATQGQAERAELEALLNSGIFNRSPILATFLRYICDRYFEGSTENLKEYSIAVEAFKRPADFDQKKDAIVRVEAHRLRKRLAEYYQKDGADHPIQIEIPNGQYAPRFVYKKPEPQEVMTEVTEPPVSVEHEADTGKLDVPEPALAAETNSQTIPRWVLPVIGLAAVCIAMALIFWRTDKTVSKATPVTATREVWQGDSDNPVASDFRILCGYHGQPFVDRQGRTWLADAYYSGGVSVPIQHSASIEGLPDPRFAPTQRVGNFEYSIPVSPGTYEVHLHFVEMQSGDVDGSGPKLFNVSVNGKVMLDHMDPLSDAGAARRLSSRVLTGITAAKDGHIHLKFDQQGTQPELVGLEILAITSDRVRPLRIVAAMHSTTDVDGSAWMADEFAVGGNLLERKGEVLDSGLRNLYTGERYGNFSYHIPLPPGKYRLKLYFAESYFDSKATFGALPNGIGARVFNVFADGETLLRNFDVTKEAGGPHRALIKTFENLEPNAQGKIVLEFVPVKNYAEVNAIEVMPM